MPKPKINNKAPIFRGDCTGGKEISLSELLKLTARRGECFY